MCECAAECAPPLKGPDSFVLTYKIFGSVAACGVVRPPYEVGASPTGVDPGIHRWT